MADRKGREPGSGIPPEKPALSSSPDVGAYLRRLGIDRPAAPDMASLESIHVAHLAAIPFENIDVRLGRTIDLSVERIEEKMVRTRRGGYCFEQNTLFAAVLRALGFDVESLEARVRPPGATAVLPRTHMILRIHLDGAAWLADVGFGGDGPLKPVPLDGSPSEQAEGAYAVAREGGEVRVLRRRWRGTWRDLYSFTMIPPQPVDFEVANHYTSTHPASVFRKTLTVQRSQPGLRRILRGTVFTTRRGEEESAREVAAGEVHGLLRTEFGIEVPEEDAIRAAVSD